MAIASKHIRARIQHRIASKSQPHVRHYVQLEPDKCSCMGFYRHGHCWHLNRLRRLVFFAELIGCSIEAIEANLEKAKARGLCASPDCYFCSVNHELGCPRVADVSTNQAVNCIHGYLIDAA